MLAREQVLHSLLELASGSAALTPIESGDRVLRIALSLVECEGVALLAPRHRDGVRMLRGRSGTRYEPEARGRDGSTFVRRIARMGHPMVVANLAAETHASAEDAFPGVSSGPAVFIPFGSRDTALGYLAAYRSAGAPEFQTDQVRLLTVLATAAALALDNRRLAHDLQKLAVTDDLTQVYNYRFLKTALRRELKRAQRFAQPLAIVMLDVDNLKPTTTSTGTCAAASCSRSSPRLLRRAGALVRRAREVRRRRVHDHPAADRSRWRDGRGGARARAVRATRSQLGARGPEP
jgi:predicted signal transduction protein with EAL and GGDEF domain